MITLPDNTLWVTDDLAVAIIPGDVCPCVPGTAPAEWCAGCPGIHAPQEWAQYDKLCELCELDTHTGCPVCQSVCPACRDGRQVWEVRWRCPDCGGSGDEMVDSMTLYGIPGGFDVGGPCPTCYDVLPTAGFLSARATLQVVPVVDEGYFFGSGGLPDLPVILVKDDCAYLMRSWVIDRWSEDQVLPLDPLPVVGRDFGLIVKLADARV